MGPRTAGGSTGTVTSDRRTAAGVAAADAGTGPTAEARLDGLAVFAGDAVVCSDTNWRAEMRWAPARRLSMTGAMAESRITATARTPSIAMIASLPRGGRGFTVARIWPTDCRLTMASV